MGRWWEIFTVTPTLYRVGYGYLLIADAIFGAILEQTSAGLVQQVLLPLSRVYKHRFVGNKTNILTSKYMNLVGKAIKTNVPEATFAKTRRQRVPRMITQGFERARNVNRA